MNISEKPYDVPIKNRLKMIAIHTTNVCNISCKECSHKGFRNENSFHMNLNDLKKFIKRSVELNQKYDTIILSGGEPTCWINIEDGLKIIKKSNISKKISIITNGINTKKIISISHLLNRIDVSNYGTFNSDNISYLKKQANCEVKVLEENNYHVVRPTVLDNNFYPPECTSSNITVIKDKIYWCPNIYTLSRDFNTVPTWCCNLEDDWVKYFKSLKENKYPNVCSTCLANKKLFKYLVDNNKLVLFTEENTQYFNHKEI